MDDKKLIKSWHTRAADEDYFSKYVFEYLAFIGFLKRVKFTNQNGDSGAVRQLKRSESIRDAYLQKVKNIEEVGTSWKNIEAELNERPLGMVDENSWQLKSIWYWSCSCKNIEDRESHVCEEQGKIRNLEDWENMVEFWHSIRNNLFHGSKEPEDERDQLLVENGYKTLKALVEIFIMEEEQNA